MIFLRIVMYFQSSHQDFKKNLTKPYKPVPGFLHKCPWNLLLLTERPLAGLKQGRAQGGRRRRVFGDSGRRRRGARGGGGRGDLELPLGGFGAARGGLWRRRRVLRRPATGLCRGSATQARGKWRGLADEVEGDEGELLVGSV